MPKDTPSRRLVLPSKKEEYISEDWNIWDQNDECSMDASSATDKSPVNVMGFPTTSNLKGSRDSLSSPMKDSSMDASSSRRFNTGRRRVERSVSLRQKGPSDRLRGVARTKSEQVPDRRSSRRALSTRNLLLTGDDNEDEEEEEAFLEEKVPKDQPPIDPRSRRSQTRRSRSSLRLQKEPTIESAGGSRSNTRRSRSSLNLPGDTDLEYDRSVASGSSRKSGKSMDRSESSRSFEQEFAVACSTTSTSSRRNAATKKCLDRSESSRAFAQEFAVATATDGINGNSRRTSTRNTTINSHKKSIDRSESSRQEFAVAPRGSSRRTSTARGESSRTVESSSSSSRPLSSSIKQRPSLNSGSRSKSKRDIFDKTQRLKELSSAYQTATSHLLTATGGSSS